MRLQRTSSRIDITLAVRPLLLACTSPHPLAADKMLAPVAMPGSSIRDVAKAPCELMHKEAYAKLSLKKYRPMAARNEAMKVFSGLL
jgi:hypothetical protein